MKTKLLLVVTILAFSTASLAQQRSVSCTAYPSCDTPGKVCKGVKETYTVPAAGKREHSAGLREGESPGPLQLRPGLPQSRSVRLLILLRSKS